MKAVTGLLGRTATDGTTDPNPTSSMIRHLNAALKKPAPDARLIFIDLNTPLPQGISLASPPPFADRVTKRLDQYEQKELPSGESAYVFITSFDFHRDLDGLPQLFVLPYGLGIPDFNRPGTYRLSEMHRRDQAHADALQIAEACSKLLTFPSTFDGSLPSVAFERVQPIIIGETITFPGADGTPITGIVTTASVLEPEKAAYVGVTTAEGSCIVQALLTEKELIDYRAHPEAYFGKILHVCGKAETGYDMFKFFMTAYASLTREQLLERLKLTDNLAALSQSDDELRAIFCEAMVAQLPKPKTV